jgi:hypothetical protein
VARRGIETLPPNVSVLDLTLGQEISKCDKTGLLPSESLLGRGGAYWMLRDRTRCSRQHSTKLSSRSRLKPCSPVRPAKVSCARCVSGRRHTEV